MNDKYDIGNKQAAKMACEQAIEQWPVDLRNRDLIERIEKLLSEKISLRDQFAMAALQGICTTLTRDRIMDIFEDVQAGRIEAETALKIADAMMKARKCLPADD